MELVFSKDHKETIKNLAAMRDRIRKEIHKIIIGQDQVIDYFLTALFANGHCLLVGVPGLAKTLLINTIAQCLDLSFKRIQFTPDLMPSDITGTDILTEDKSTGKRIFQFVKGPLFGQLILADEINRTPPKTQAALLQAMQERRVNAGNHTFNLDNPFFVLATQNPIEQEGTYPLPEAQLDRFLFNINIDYPSFEEEKEIVARTTSPSDTHVLTVVSHKEIHELQQFILTVPVAKHVLDYAVSLARNSRPNTPSTPDFIQKWVQWGAGPRASQYLILSAKSHAALHGRYTPTIDDINTVATPVLQHRILLNFAAEAEGMTGNVLISELKKYTKNHGIDKDNE